MEEAVLGGLVGAVLTFLGQWYVGPRIDHRVRAQERWEQFVIELASLVDGPLDRRGLAAQRAWSSWRALHELAASRDDLDQQRFDELNVEARNSFRNRVEEWRESMVRAEWLAKRITGDYRTASAGIRWFYTQWLGYSVSVLGFHGYGDTPTGADKDWTTLHERKKRLEEAIERLSEQIGVPVSLFQRARARVRVRRERRSLERRRADA